MFNEITKTVEWGGKTLELTTGKIARQADGAVLVKMGDSVVLCTAVIAKEQKEGADFFPLTVNYREMSYAAGKIPGGFFKTEGKSSEKEVLVSRLIDRPIRPLFHPGFFNETQVICTVLSYDSSCPSDILSIIGASAALAISGAPFEEIVAASRVGMINNEFVLNPSFCDMKSSVLDLVVAGTRDSVMMVESEADIITEERMLEAVKFAHESFQPVINLINQLVLECNAPKWEVKDLYPASLQEKIHQFAEAQIRSAFAINLKQERVNALKLISESVLQYCLEDTESNFSKLQIDSALDAVKSEILCSNILDNNARIDNRLPQDIRNIECEVFILPKTHGSALFTRGETQALVTTTLGSSADEQIIDGLDEEYKESFMLNYIFPPYSVGSINALKAPSRREVGHGKLAWRAIKNILPLKSQFPYCVRVVSEITESNGSSSMATVCGASMSLMSAGVPIKDAVAGIAMGLIKRDNKFVVLSDITGDEDHLGDMDFKVAGTKNGVTALQMDIKVSGITFEIMQHALEQARVGRLKILDKMNSVIQEHDEMSKHAPCIKSFKINKDKIRDVIGAGGKVIREICDSTGAKIDISDDGVVTVSVIGQDKLEAAINKIQSITFKPEIGDVFDGTVVKILDSGAFINYNGSKDGFIHISELSTGRVASVTDVVNIGDIVKVRILGFDNKGRVKLTLKDMSDNISNNVNSDESDSNSNKSTKSVKTKSNLPMYKKRKVDDMIQDADGADVQKGQDRVVTERKYFN